MSDPPKSKGAWWRIGWSWLFARKPPQAWAVYAPESGVWTKVVTYQKPNTPWAWMRRGPFRSELDCEEFCDHANLGAASQVRLYNRTLASANVKHKEK